MFIIKRFSIGIIISLIMIISFLGCEKMTKSPTAMDGEAEVQQLNKRFLTTPLSTAPDIIVTTTSDAADFGGSQQAADLPGPDGLVSLREAIMAANNTSGPNVIGFNIPTSDPGFDGDVFTIKPNEIPFSPFIDDGTTIDGATQAVFSGNSNISGPEIVLDGSMLTNGWPIEILSSWNHIHSIVINSSWHSGILISGNVENNKVTGCFIGTDHTGIFAKGNGANGVDIADGPSKTVIGGPNPGEGNLLSGNNSWASGGVNIFKASENVVQGNLIGIDVTGTKKIPNHNGISITGKNNIIGGVEENARNIISGNLYGIQVSGLETEANVIQGNFIGSDITGTISLSNEGGGMIIRDGAHHNIVGGDGSEAGNVISGNGRHGIFISAPYNSIQGNYIGVDVSGNLPLGNGKSGVGFDQEDGIRIVTSDEENAEGNYIVNNVISANTGHGIGIFGSDRNIIKGNLIGTDKNGSIKDFGNTANGIQIQCGPIPVSATGNVIGGPSEIDRNIIAGNWCGIHLIEADRTFIEGNSIYRNAVRGIVVSSPGIQNTITANSIHHNGQLGIDLANNGVTPNDPGDFDTGPNNLQNYPVLMSVLATPGRLIVHGTLDTPNPETATIEFFANPVPDPGGDPSGHGEGAIYIGSKKPNRKGKFTAALPPVEPGTLISATATDANGNTSEFSANIEAQAPGH